MEFLSYNNNYYIEYTRHEAYKYTIRNIHFDNVFVRVVLPLEGGGYNQIDLLIVKGGTGELVLPGDDIYTIEVYINNNVEPTPELVHKGFLVEVGMVMEAYTKLVESLYCVELDQEQVTDKDCPPAPHCGDLENGKVWFGGSLSERRGLLAQINAILFLFFTTNFRNLLGNESYHLEESKFEGHKTRIIALWQELRGYLKLKVEV